MWLRWESIARLLPLKDATACELHYRSLQVSWKVFFRGQGARCFNRRGRSAAALASLVRGTGACRSYVRLDPLCTKFCEQHIRGRRPRLITCGSPIGASACGAIGATERSGRMPPMRIGSFNRISEGFCKGEADDGSREGPRSPIGGVHYPIQIGFESTQRNP